MIWGYSLNLNSLESTFSLNISNSFNGYKVPPKNIKFLDLSSKV